MGIRTLLQKAIERETISIEASEGDNNPQVKEMHIEAKARKQAFEATLQALRGDRVGLRLYG